MTRTCVVELVFWQGQQIGFSHRSRWSPLCCLTVAFSYLTGVLKFPRFSWKTQYCFYCSILLVTDSYEAKHAENLPWVKLVCSKATTQNLRRPNWEIEKVTFIDFQVSMMSMVHVYSLYSLYLARLLSGFPDSARFDLDVLKVRDCRNNSGCKPYALQISRRWISTHTMALWSKSVFLHVCDQKFCKSRSMQEYLPLCNMLCLTHRTLFAFGTELLTSETWANHLFFFPLCTVKWEATEGCTSHCGIAWSFLGEVAYQRPHRWCISLLPRHLDPTTYEFQNFSMPLFCGLRICKMSESRWLVFQSQVRRLAPQYILMDIASPDAIFLRAAMAKIG